MNRAHRPDGWGKDAQSLAELHERWGSDHPWCCETSCGNIADWELRWDGSIDTGTHSCDKHLPTMKAWADGAADEVGATWRDVVPARPALEVQ